MSDDVVVSQKPRRPARMTKPDVAELHNTSQDSSDSCICYAERLPCFDHPLDFDPIQAPARKQERSRGRLHRQNVDVMYLDSKQCRFSTKPRAVLRVNYCLMFVCVAVAAVYVLTILNLHKVFLWPHQKPVHLELQASGFHGGFPFCVQRGTWLDNFTLDFDHRWKHNNSGEKICFSSLDWIPAIVERVLDLLKATVSRSVSSSVDFRPLQIPDQSHPFAYLVADVQHLQTGQDISFKGSSRSSVIKWSAPDNKTSHLNSVHLNTEKNSLTVTQSGYYFIFTHLELSSSSSLRTLCVYKNYRNNKGTPLMAPALQGSKSMLSFTQAVVQLVENDTISVVTQFDSSDLANINIYIGLFLV